MLVKKINPEWKPSENKELKVGETIEMTDAKALILNGDAVAIGDRGQELSAYELYGVIVERELQEFEEYTKMKKAQAEKDSLEKEQAALKAAVATTVVAPKEEAPKKK